MAKVKSSKPAKKKGGKKKNKSFDFGPVDRVGSGIKVVLPTKKSKPRDGIGRSLIFLFGERKIGKTSLASKFPGNFLLECESGGDWLQAHQPQDENGHPKHITSYPELVAWKDAIVAQDRFETVTLDTADRAFELACKQVCEDEEIDHIGDLGFGKGWHRAADMVMSLCREITESGRGMIMISHNKIKDIDLWDGQKESKLVSTLTSSIYEKATSEAGLWAFYGYDGDHRYLWIRGNQFMDAGVRMGDRFRTPKGKPLDRIYMGKNEDEAYANFMAAWDCKPLPYKRKANKELKSFAPAK